MENLPEPKHSGKKRKHKTSTSEVAEKIKLSAEPVKQEKLKKIKNETFEVEPKEVSSMKTTSEVIKNKKKSGNLIKSPKKDTKSNIIVSESETKKVKLEELLDNEGGDKDTFVKKKKKEKTPNRNILLDDVLPLCDNEEIKQKYPVLFNEELIARFRKVNVTCNRKGRIRKAIQKSLHGAPLSMYADLVHSKLQEIMKGSEDLSIPDLRRVRVIYHMLRTAIETPDKWQPTKEPKSKENTEKKTEKTDKSQKVKRPKKYVVLLRKLPLDIDKEKIMNHFVELNENIKDIRIPKPAEGMKSAIAYVELMNEPSFELALSKHHSMLDSKRIRVLQTDQMNGEISQTKAKDKSEKLTDQQNSENIVDSKPMNKKRRHQKIKAKTAENKDT